MPIPLGDPALDHLIAQMQQAMAQFVNGHAAAFKALWSQQPDVTIVGGWGADQQGSEAVGPRLDCAAPPLTYLWGRGLGRKHAAVWLFGETLTLKDTETALTQYHVDHEPDERYIRALTEPRLFPSHFPAPQPFLFDVGDVERRVVMRLPPYKARRRRCTATLTQEHLFP